MKVCFVEKMGSSPSIMAKMSQLGSGQSLSDKEALKLEQRLLLLKTHQSSTLPHYFNNHL